MLLKVTLRMLGRIALEGFIAVPSKYVELSHPEGPWLGYSHHRWICSMRSGVLKLYPKLRFFLKICFESVLHDAV